MNRQALRRLALACAALGVAGGLAWIASRDTTARAAAAPAKAPAVTSPAAISSPPLAQPAITPLPTQPAQPGDWPSFGNDPGGSQYSPLDQITAANVAGLELAWVHRSGEAAGQDAAVGPAALEVVPIHVNDTLYFCTPLNRVIALDPATGREKWRFDPHAAAPGAPALLDEPRRPGICRGVAYWQPPQPRAGVACEKRIFRGDVTGRVFAIDADTGRACRDFGAAAGHPGYVSHADFDSKGTGDTPRGSTSPPVVIGDLVVAAAGARDSITDANNGFVRAFDARSGELRWAFDPIPAEHAHDTGAANAWSTLSVDPQRGLVFVPTTSPSTDYYGANRPFEVPLSNATVALSARTGEPVWHYQAVRHDLFDFDLPGHPLLVTIRRQGRELPVAIQQTKQGRVLVLHRDTGQPVFPVKERAAPKSDIPGEHAAPTQPDPVLPEPFSRQELTEDDIWGLTPLDRAWCRREFRRLRYEGPYTPPSERGSLTFPFGGGNWGGVAYHPGRNLLVAKGQNLGARVRLVRREAAGDPPRGNDLVGTPYRSEVSIFLSPLGVPCTPPPFGTVSAIDMDSGRLRWQVPLGRARYKGITAPEFLRWGSPNVGGPIVTAGGLVFIGAALDARLRALDLEDGRVLWEGPLEAPGMSVPMTYLAGGRQYVVIAAGGNPRMSPEVSDALMAFALPQAASTRVSSR